jgi:hypothetical protein
MSRIMPLSIAEYLGYRTDIISPDIIPSVLGGATVPTCPFSGSPCIKLKSSRPSHPICSVRFNAQVFIVCSNRLIPAQAKAISPSHTAALASIAGTLFPGVNAKNIGFRRQIGVVGLYLDYVLTVNPSINFSDGPSRVILEIQGGGETSNTGTITRYVNDWIDQNNPTNNFLSQEFNTKFLKTYLNQKKVGVPGIIPNNAWKRQLDQIIKKSVIAKEFSGGFALVMGELFYKYVQEKSIPAQQPYFSTWEVALIGVSEDTTNSPAAGAIPITHVSDSTFMTYSEFMAALQGFSIPSKTLDPFAGKYTTLSNSSFTI